MPLNISNVTLQELNNDLFTEKKIQVSVLRLDKIHPVVSGNKYFKLHYFLKNAAPKTVITFGGAYSNHLAAAAFACRELGVKSVGIVRGERPPVLSPTLQQCIADGMQLKFISRQLYANKDSATFLQSLQSEFGQSIVIPEGGYHPLGAKGAALITNLINEKKYTHLCCATGTATTIAGLLLAAGPDKNIIAVPALKGMSDMAERLAYLTGKPEQHENLTLFNEYHFGGYAKYNDELLDFMNTCWQQYALPLDFVYTAKMMYAVTDKIKNNYFSPGSEIICIHTGGLQGNNSLPLNRLMY